MAKEGASKKMSQRQMQELLIDNFVGLQKAMTNLSIKFESLSEQIRHLLEIFEVTAKNFSATATDSADKADLIDKLNALIEQNKVLARGIVLLEDRLPKQEQQQLRQAPMSNEDQGMRPKPLPRL